MHTRFQALASLYPNHSDVQECLIIGDNSSTLSYWRRTARVRRPALVTVLHQAQLIAATELPRISWRYVPREANKEADFLAGIASAAARNKATLPISLPAPAGEEWQSTAAIAISDRSSFCLVECPTFHAQDLAHIRAHHPTYRAALEAYIASGGECVGSNAQGVTVLKQVPYPSLHRQVRNGSLPQRSLSLTAQAFAWLSAPPSMRRTWRTSVPTTLHTALRLKLILPLGGSVSALMLRGSLSSSRSRTGSMVMTA